MSATSCTSGIDPSGKVAVVRPDMTSSRGSRRQLLDVRREPLVEELQRLVRHRAALATGGVGRSSPCSSRAERLVIGFGNAEQIGDHHQRERVRVVADELALAAVEELVDLAIGELPHELLVLLQALRRDQPQQQPAVRGVLRRIERRQLIAERQRVAVLVDDRADVVAFERQPGTSRTARPPCCTTRTSRGRCRPASPRRSR